jgi:hypothetical protein
MNGTVCLANRTLNVIHGSKFALSRLPQLVGAG